jgi:hypothetical protein
MKKNIMKFLASLFVVAFATVSCTEDVVKSDYDYVPDATKLPAVTLTLGEITGASVECFGVYTPAGTDTTLLEKGFICATDADFTAGVVSVKNDSANYHGIVSGVKELTDYFVKAYVITKDGIAYSEVLTFSTPMLKNPLVDYVGTYVQSDYLYADNTLEAAYNVEFVEIVGNTKQLKLVNFWDGGEEIVVDFNLTAKTISIAPQNMYTHSSYGETKAYPYNGTAADKTGTPVLGTIGEDGTLTLSSWGAGVTAGFFGYYKSSTFIPVTNTLAGTYTEVDYLAADGSVESTYTDKIIIAPVAYELNKIEITNLWDGGDFTIVATMNFEEGTFTIAPQVIYKHATYGDCKIYPYDKATNTIDKSGAPTTGVIEEDGSLTIGGWAAVVDAGSFGKYEKSTLTKSAAAGIRAKMKLISSPNASSKLFQTKYLK